MMNVQARGLALLGKIGLVQITNPTLNISRRAGILLPVEGNANFGGYTTTFVGRQQEIGNLGTLFESGKRVVTITAPGGYGKSRLAAQFCGQHAGDFNNGVRTVLLAPLADPTSIVGATADAVGFNFYGQADPKKQLLDFLREKNILLCFDNFEHLLDGSELLAEILEHSPGVSILVTSREPLGLLGEFVFALNALPVATESSSVAKIPGDAVTLFIDRAQKINPQLQIDDESLGIVGMVCDCLSGVPLAIELTAAWADKYSLPELYKEVKHQLDITVDDPQIPKRHRSVRASCDWSHNLLSDDLKLILRCVATFKGGFFLEAGEAVVPVSDLRLKLEQLVRKNWAYTVDVHGTPRYFISDAAIREYSFQKLLDSEDFEVAVNAHCNYFSNLTEVLGEQLQGCWQLETVQALGRELENIFAAIDTGIAKRQTTTLVPIAKHLHPYLVMVGGYQTGLKRYEKLLDAGIELESSEIELHARLGLVGIMVHLGMYEDSRLDCQSARDLAQQIEDQHSVATACIFMGDVERFEGNHPAAREQYRQSLALMRQLKDQVGIANALHDLGLIELIEGNYNDANSLFNDSLVIMRELGHRYGIAYALNNLGSVAYRQGRYDEARELHLESLELRRGLGDRYGIAQSLNNLGNVEFGEQDYDKTLDYYQASLDLKREIGELFGIAASLNNLGNAAYCCGNLDQAEDLHVEGLEIKREIGDLVGISFSLNNLANISIRKENYSAAIEQLTEALEIAVELSSTTAQIAPLAIAAGLFYKLENLELAAKLMFGAYAQLKRTGYLLDPMDGHYFEAIKHLLDQPGNGIVKVEATASTAQLGLSELVSFVKAELTNAAHNAETNAG